SYHALIQTGLYPKLKQFPQLGQSPSAFGWSAHQWTREEGRGLSIDPNTEWSKQTDNHFTLGNAHVTDECWFRVAGYQIGIPDWDEVWLVMTVYDEEAIIRFQFNPYGRQFPVAIGGLFNDVHKSHAQSLYDLLLPLHDIATWLLRSRVDNVQASLNNLIFADPTMVNINDLIDRNPWGVVQTMPGAKSGEGFFVAQVPDITRGHWNDIAALSDMKQRLAAASDAQQGMPTADGIRTATEIQRLTQLGSQRLGVISRVLSATTIRPMVRMMVSNIQDAMAYEGSIRLDQSNMPSNLAGMTQEGYLDYGVKDLQGNIDYLVVDGTLPIEPTRSPETWMNMLQVLNQTGMMMEFDMPRIVEEAIRSMGVPDLDQFRITQEKQAQGPTPSQQLAMLEKMRGASVQPEQQIQSEVQKGNLIPLSQARKSS
ncbi:MAG: portal protein, partial [Billgrantia desiderata]